MCSSHPALTLDELFFTRHLPSPIVLLLTVGVCAELYAPLSSLDGRLLAAAFILVNAFW
jgi:hypothetical protein